MNPSQKCVERLFGPSSFERAAQMQIFIDRFYEKRARMVGQKEQRSKKT